MFAKLLKHEIKSTGGLLGILSGAALAVGVVGGFVLRFVMNTSASAQDTEASTLLAGMLLPFVFISLFAYAFGGEIYVAVRFYKRKFTDQGYLTFTLPVHGWEIYLSSLLNMMLWSLVIGIVMFLSIGALILIAVYDTEAWYMMLEAFEQYPLEMELVFAELGPWSVVAAILSFLSGNVLLITSITLGCVVAKKHKVLSSIGFYYLISMAVSSVSSTLSISYASELEASFDTIYMTSSALYAVVILLGSWLSIWLMDKKLNLP